MAVKNERCERMISQKNEAGAVEVPLNETPLGESVMFPTIPPFLSGLLSRLALAKFWIAGVVGLASLLWTLQTTRQLFFELEVMCNFVAASIIGFSIVYGAKLLAAAIAILGALMALRMLGWMFAIVGFLMQVAKWILSLAISFAVKRVYFSSVVALIVILLTFLTLKPLSLEIIQKQYAHGDRKEVASLGASLEKHAILPGSLKQKYGGGRQDSIFLSAPPLYGEGGGHQYVALNRVECGNVTPEQLTAKVSEDLNRVFPILAIGEKGSNAVTLLNTIDLGKSNNPVTVEPLPDEVLNKGEKPHYFILRAEAGHLLQGEAHHGFVRDGNGKGDLWLFQYGQGQPPGVGLPKELLWKQFVNYRLADIMWARMARNVTQEFGR